MLHGAPDLVAYGAMPAALARFADADAELTAVERRDAALLGTGAGASALLAGLTLWARCCSASALLAGLTLRTLLLGVAAVQDGVLAPVPLAVLVLTALAAFEIVAPLPGAAARLGTVRAAGARLFDVLDTPPALTPRLTATPAPAATGCACAGCACATAPPSRGRSTASTSTCPRAAASPWWARAARARARSPRCCSASATPTPAPCTWTAPTSRRCPPTPCAPR
ncbi:hypothetical protein BJF90_35650 [Pseudonocardia sp. CNS-004]|nr:hypothetical protein BJF90_35650 [Pseudonocardia sp. CNS-004]